MLQCKRLHNLLIRTWNSPFAPGGRLTMANDESKLRMVKKIRSSMTIKQVAQKAGVSTATVSRVITGKAPVSDELTHRVQEAISILDYHTNRTARGLRARTMQKVGVVLSDMQNPFFTRTLSGIEKVLLDADYVLLLGNSDENPKREQIHLDTLHSEGVDGIIVSIATSDPKAYQKILRAGTPLVLIDRVLPGLKVDSVVVNNIRGAFQATEHLIHLGHRRIGFIGGIPQMSTSLDRKEGYLQALVNHHIPVNAALIVDGNFRQEGGYMAMQQLLDMKEPPTAVLVANNLMTLGALRKIHEHRLSIPNDLAVIGFDDMDWATSLNPPLTVVAQPSFEMGLIAAQLLLSRIQESSSPTQQVVLETTLIIRESCGAPVSSKETSY